jgi:hypothetical protein
MTSVLTIQFLFEVNGLKSIKYKFYCDTQALAMNKHKRI